MISCSNDPEKPGRIFMPDMVYHRSYQPYAPSPVFDDSLSSRMPVHGTIPFGALPQDPDVQTNENMLISFRYHHYIPNTEEGYEMAGEMLENPYHLTEEIISKGKRLYAINCAVCHGDDGGGVGPIVENGAYPQVPSFQDRLPLITEGQMFHSITYGRNLMGPYAGQVTPEERWALIYYIQQLAGTGPFMDEGTEEETEAEIIITAEL